MKIDRTRKAPRTPRRRAKLAGSPVEPNVPAREPVAEEKPARRRRSKKADEESDE